MKTSFFVLGVVVAVVVGLVGGYFWGYPLGYAKGGAAVTAAYAPKIVQVNALFPVPTDLRSLSGKVTGISGMTFALQVATFTQNPFAGDFPAVREVTVTNATKITGVSQQSRAAFQAEQQAFMKKMAADRSAPGAALIMPPPAPSSTDMAFSDISVGDAVAVTADSNILNSPNFTATALSF
jgi:hypothetical protein